MAITRVKLENFTAFRDFEFLPGAGINVLIGENGTGKTHLLNVAYAACAVAGTGRNLADKLVGVFCPSGNAIGRLVRRGIGRGSAELRVEADHGAIGFTFDTAKRGGADVDMLDADKWHSKEVQCVYLPAKEILSQAPGLRSLHKAREFHVEETYVDLIDRALLPAFKGAPDSRRVGLLRIIEESLKDKVDKVVVKDEEFFLYRREGNLEFMLLAEGLRKLALLSRLTQTYGFPVGSVVFWDEPEANLSPKHVRTIAKFILRLERRGVQVFVATHDYVLLKWLDLERTPQNAIRYHALYHDELTRDVLVNSTDDYLQVHPSAIADAFDDLYDADIRRALGRGK